MLRHHPEIEISYDELPSDPVERHEALVDIFGQYVNWIRDWSVGTTRGLGESEQSRENIRAVNRDRWEKLAQLSNEERTIVYDISEATIDRFVQMLLVMLGNQGVDQQLGNNHSIRFKLDLEICSSETNEVVETETINRGGKKFFGDYWGRWLNRLRGKS